MPDDPTPLPEALEVRLTQAAGRFATLLSETRMALRDRSGFHDEIVALIGNDDTVLADGASWILKAELESGWQISATLSTALLDHLPKVTSWPTQLHLLQSLDRLRLSPPDRTRFRDWATPLMQHKRPLIRAWAMHACVRLAEDTNGASGILDTADADPAASVRARARRLRADL